MPLRSHFRRHDDAASDEKARRRENARWILKRPPPTPEKERRGTKTLLIPGSAPLPRKIRNDFSSLTRISSRSALMPPRYRETLTRRSIIISSHVAPCSYRVDQIWNFYSKRSNSMQKDTKTCCSTFRHVYYRQKIRMNIFIKLEQSFNVCDQSQFIILQYYYHPTVI